MILLSSCSNAVVAIMAVALTILIAAPFSDSFVVKNPRARSAFACRSVTSKKLASHFRPESLSATTVGMPEISRPPPQHYSSISSMAESFQQWIGRLLSSLVVRGKGDTQDGILDDKAAHYLVHTGPTTPMLIRAASVASFTLAQGWSNGRDDTSLEAFERAVRDVVRANPILTGRAMSIQGAGGLLDRDEIHVVPGAFLPDGADSHSFVEVIDARKKSPSPLGLREEDLLNYIDKFVSPLIPNPCAPTIDQIQNQAPLFWTKVVLLPDNYACFYIGMSHCLGDITTFTNLLDQLSSSRAGRHKPREIDWDNSIKATHQLSPKDFSDRDTCIAYGLPFLIGLGANVIGKGERKNQFLTLSSEKIRAKRQELYNSPTDDNATLSSNDIITAALCESCGSSDIFAFTRSLREMRHGEYGCLAGNLYIEIPFSRREGSDPNAFHRIMRRGRYYERDKLPLWPFLTGRVGRITSCIAPKGMKFDFGNTQTVCHSPPKAFLQSCPFDCAVIFTMDPDHVGIMHNFLEVDETGLLEQLKAE